MSRTKMLSGGTSALAAMAMVLGLQGAVLPGSALGQGPLRVDHAATPVATAQQTSSADDAEIRLPAAPAIDEGSSGPNVRTRSDRQGSDQIPEPPDPTATPTPDNSVPRLDDPVLRWLPEIVAASEQWGVPPELIAAVMRIESTGEPGVISPAGARGLMQMMPDQIGGQGVPEYLWHDPAANVSAGAQGLYTRMLAQGSWEGAVGAYLGFGCDVWGTCTDVYVRVVFGWADYYRPIIANPRESGFRILPSDWAYGPIVLYQIPAPPKLEEPPETPTPSPTTTVSETPAATEPPDESTAVPTESVDPAPTEIAPTTAPPTEVPPTDVPPTEVPTAEPTQPPPPPTEAPAEPTPSNGKPDKLPASFSLWSPLTASCATAVLPHGVCSPSGADHFSWNQLDRN